VQRRQNAGVPHDLASRHLKGSTRVVVALASGVVAAFVVAWFVPWQLAVLVGWDVAALTVVGGVWLVVGRFDELETATFATREDPSRTVSELLLLLAATASLAGVGLAFAKAQEGDPLYKPLLTAFGVLTIALSWALVHTLFALRYAHLYYTDVPEGIDFKSNGVEQPDYQDFAYTAFTVGMTFQVSDTDITRRVIRRTVLRHALLSFLFGAVIVASAVNIVATLLN
jgi:uncharacterized membrane protein